MPSTRLQIRVIPRARKDEVAERRGDAIVVRLQAPPVEGAANKALLKFLAKALGVRPADLTVVAGEKSRDKVVQIEGLSQEDVEKALIR
jgi:uncharacterized protein (TIGR00251 family)